MSMNTHDGISRRSFIAASAAAGLMVAGTRATHAAERPGLKKSLKFGMISSNDGKLSIADRLEIAAEAGFVGVEPNTIFDEAQVEEFRKGAEAAKIRIDAVVCGTHWRDPLSDPDPAVYEKTMEGMRQSIRNAKALGGDMVLLVPAVVNPQVMYKDAWTRSVDRVKRLAEYAEEHEITIGIENVWNKFLLSPIESKAYIEEIGSERVRYWFDVGNVVLFGYPQDWIRTLGPLIARVDLKDFDAGKKAFVPLLEGSVDWPEVMKAFDEIGYEGYFAAEVQGGDTQYLTEVVSERMDKIIAM